MTVIEMLTAEMPFSDFSNPFAVMFQIARIKEMPVPEYLSSEATEFIRKCLRVDPAERPSAKVGTETLRGICTSTRSLTLLQKQTLDYWGPPLFSLFFVLDTLLSAWVRAMNLL
jgi:serine/threonine protein kinase